jgi:hypothetical protein
MLILNKYKHQIPEGAVSIMRPSKWGNPFVLKKDGNRQEVLVKYKAWLQELLALPAFRLALVELSKAPALVCCCKPQACHGDLLIEAMRELGLIQQEVTDGHPNSQEGLGSQV